MQLDDLVSEYTVLDEEHDRLKLRIADVEKEKQEIQAQALQKLNDLNADKLRIARYEIERKPMRGYKVTSWQAFYDWIIENNRFDALHRAVSVTTMDDVAETEGLPPGVERTDWNKANFKKVSKAR